MLKFFRKYIKYNCEDNLPDPKTKVTFWNENKNYISYEILDKIYNHIKNRKIHYYINDYIIIGIIKTKKLGYVQLYIDSIKVSFKVYNTGISYSLYNIYTHEKLNKYINNFINIAKTQYNKDLNL